MSQAHSDLLCEDDQQYLFTCLNGQELDAILDDSGTLLGDSPEEIKDLVFTNDYSQGNFYMENNEDKKDVITPNQHTLQNVLSKEKYAGPYEFEVEVHNPNNSKYGYLYSSNSRKIYTKMDTQVQISFKVKYPPPEKMFIRVTPVYSDPQSAQEVVNRCLNHAYKDTDEKLKQHIIRCGNSQVQYLGDIKKNERFNLLIPLTEPQIGTDRVMEMFQFVCQNSCPAPGMHRRAIEVIFTLEDTLGNICGRQTFHVRICCSPKRDMTKEKKEKEICDKKTNSRNKRSIQKPEKPELPAPTQVDTNVYSVTLNIVGKENVQYILKYSQDLMAGQVLSHKNEAAEECFQNCHDNIAQMREELE